MAQSPYLDQNAPEILALERQKKLADLLQARALEQPQGQMVSGRFVAPSLVQQLAPLANAYMGRKASEDVESRQSKLANLIRGQQTEQANKFTDLMYGKAGTPDVEAMPETITTPTGERVLPSAMGSRDDMGNLLPNFAVNPAQEAVKGTATQGNLLEALKFAQSTGNPTLIAQVQEQLKPFTLAENAIRRQFNPVTNQYETIGEGNIKKEKETFPPEIKSTGMIMGYGTDPAQYTAQQLATIGQKIKQDKLDLKPVQNINVEAAKADQKTFQNIVEIKKAFNQEPIYKAYQEIQSAYGQINEGIKAKSPAGDLVAATKFMKLLDPTSVVRESELALALKAGGALDRLENYVQNVAAGTKLTPKQREDFHNLATKFNNLAVQQYNSKRTEWADVAKSHNLNPNLAVGNEANLEFKSGVNPNNPLLKIEPKQ
jgi:hypothetical protein